jgi:hypothetical protein
MKKAILAAAAMLFASPGIVHSQQQATAPSPAAGPAPATSATCISQYEDTALSAASSMAQGYKIEAAVPGGLWLQKETDLLYCNAGRPRDGAVLCWKLREPLKNQPCQ